jgi:hypothetical protein
MVSTQHRKPLGKKQEITNYAVAASKLSNPLCLIIGAVCLQSSKKKNSFTTKSTKEHEGFLLNFFLVILSIRMLFFMRHFYAASSVSCLILTAEADIRAQANF